jgi:hypothetical protein
MSIPSSIKPALSLLLVLVVGLSVYYFAQRAKAPTSEVRNVPLEINAAKQRGDDEAAMAYYFDIQNDPTETAVTKAWATLQVFNTKFRITGDINDLLVNIREVKKIAIDPSLPTTTRATAITQLAYAYSSTGRNPAVLGEIYKDPPFDQYYVADDPALSALNLAEWSYAMQPSPRAAIYAAQYYAGEYFPNPPKKQIEIDYVNKAEDYLKKAEAASLLEMEESPGYGSSDRYVSFRVRRAITIGRLAILKGEPYKSEYRREFEDLFALVQPTQVNLNSRNALLSGRYHYAITLGLENDVENQKKVLDSLGNDLSRIGNYNIPFAAFLRTEYEYRPQGRSVNRVREFANISPSFKIAVEKVLSSPIQ